MLLTEFKERGASSADFFTVTMHVPQPPSPQDI